MERQFVLSDTTILVLKMQTKQGEGGRQTQYKVTGTFSIHSLDPFTLLVLFLFLTSQTSMASSLSSSHLSVSPQQSDLCSSFRRSSRKSNIIMASVTPVFKDLASSTCKINRKEQGSHALVRNSLLFRFAHTCQDSFAQPNSKRWISSALAASLSCSLSSTHTIGENVLIMDSSDKNDLKSSKIDSLVQVLHKSARSFSVAIKHHESARSGPELARAWVGVDVHAWHKHLSYQVAIYALLKTVTEARFLSSDEDRSDFFPVQEIISPKMNMLLGFIENQLRARDQNLAKWFKIVKLPLLEGFFIPLLKMWSSEHDRSGVAVIFLAISCCLAVEKLGTARIACPSFTRSIPGIVAKLMDLPQGLVPMEKLHNLASAAGIEQEFLSHFGSKVLPNENVQEVSFWMGLVHKKLFVALQREGVISKMRTSRSEQGLERDLATLGLFAFVACRTRLFLSRMGIKDLDEQLKDFLSYLECGSLFIYPEFSALPLYQLFVEVVAEEVDWLNLYAAAPCISQKERKRSKQHTIQAEKEIILPTIFSVCCDIFSGFTHFSNSSPHFLDEDVVDFLQQSRILLTICLEDYWAAYCRSGELLRYTDRIILPQQILPLRNQDTRDVSARGVPRKSIDQMTVEIQVTPQHKPMASIPRGSNEITMLKCPFASETNPVREGMFRNYRKKLIYATFDILIGTRLLFIDISIATGILLKQMRGEILTRRERKKLKRTLTDFASLVPVTILMLLPVSAVGHAAMLAGIKKYIPCMIPSPYLSERLDIVKQLNRTKTMEVKSWSNL